MKFTETTPNDQLHWRMVSDEGKWHLGFHRVLYGWRFQMYRDGNHHNTLDLCCGSDTQLQALTVLQVRVIMGLYDEDVTERKIQDEFPIPSACKPLTDYSLREKLQAGFEASLEKLASNPALTSNL